MTTVVLGPPPPELTDLIERRKALGQDLYDEVWEGNYHIAAAPRQWHGYAVLQIAELFSPHAKAAGLLGTDPFNLGIEDDFRVPDLGYHREVTNQAFIPTAAIVVEVVWPYDESYAKLPFYAVHGVDEVLIVDPGPRSVRWYSLQRGQGLYIGLPASGLLGVSGAALETGLTWPDD